MQRPHGGWKDIRWPAAVGGFVLAEVALIASAFGWVFLYSALVHPGESQEFYERYAQVASPWVSLVAGAPIFFVLCRWIGAQAPARAWPTALALFGLFVLVDLALVVAVAAGGGSSSPGLLGFVAASHLSKFAASHLGARSAERRITAPPDGP
jgi:hypothetical protein